MELKVMEYDTSSIRYLNQKKSLNIVFLLLFVASFVASIVVFAMLFGKGIEFAIFLISGAQILASGIYIFTCIAVVKDCNRLLESIVQNGTFREELPVPYKIDINKKISNMAIVYILCSIVVSVATIFCIVALCLTYSLTMLAEVLFMGLILLFALLMSISTVIDDNRVKAMLKNKSKE